MNPQVDLGIWRRLTQVVAALIILACLLGIFFWYLPVFQQNARMRQQIATLANQIKAEEQKQEQLTTAINLLQNDPQTVERFARQKLGYAKPGEKIIFFEPPAPNSIMLPKE